MKIKDGKICKITMKSVCLVFLFCLLFGFVSRADEPDCIPFEDEDFYNEITEIVSDDENAKIGEINLSESVYQMGSMDGVSSDILPSENLVNEINEKLTEAVTECEVAVDLSEYDLSIEEITEITAEFINSNPRFFYLNAAGVEYDEETLEVEKLFLDYKEDAAEMSYEYENEISAILQNLNPSWNEVEKVIYIHNSIIKKCDYDLDLKNRTAYDALVNGKAVCTGYALAFQDIATRAGIPTDYVTSIGLNHAWNLVTIDGKHYYVDCTWDDPLLNNESGKTHYYSSHMMYENLLKSDSEFGHGGDDWKIKGQKVRGLYEDKEFDNAVWRNAVSVTVSYDSGIYTLHLNGDIYKCSKENPSGEMIANIAGSEYVTFAYGSISSLGNSIYASGIKKVYRLNGENYEAEEVLSLGEEESLTIYGMESSGSGISVNLASGPEKKDFAEKRLLNVSEFENEKISEIKLNKNFYSFKGSERTLKLTASVNPEGTEVVWESSNPDVASVDASGNVTAHDYGSAVISASAGKNRDICVIYFDTEWQNDYEYAFEDDFDGKSEYIYLDDYLGSDTEIFVPETAVVNGEKYKTQIRGMKLSDKTSTSITRNYKGVYTESDLTKFEAKEGVSFGKYGMSCFRLDSALKSVDLSDCDMSRVEVTNSMFYGCSSLEEVDLKNCRFESLQKSTAMFGGCTSLKRLTAPAFIPEGMSISVPKEMYVVDEDGYLSVEGIKDLKDAPSNAILSCDIKITGLSLDSDSYEMSVGHRIQPEVTITPYNARIRTLSWESSDESVVKTDENGTVTAVGNGTATVTVKAMDGTGEYISCEITVSPDVIHTHKIIIDKGYEATCETAGLTDGSHCPVCGEILEEQKVIPAKGHSVVKDERVEPTYVETGLTEGCHCSVCNKVLVKQEVIPYLYGWVEKDSHKYYYRDGGKKTGWLNLEEGKYYLDERGVLLTGWIMDWGEWYLASPEGVITTGWAKDKGEWYYFNDRGIMQKGWRKIDGKWYYFSPYGQMKTGWLKYDEKKYYLTASGAMKTGWLKYEDNWYFFSSSGEMKQGWVKDNGKWYWFYKTGEMKTGWHSENGNKYYLTDSGEMKTGWLKDGEKRYFFSASGEMKKGWVKDNGNWYYTSENGIMKKGWVKISDNWYYLDSNGIMVTGKKKIGNKEYRFSSSGKCLNP